MTKYLETAKIKKHSETIGLRPYLGNRSINMIGSRGSLRPRGSQSSRYTERNYTTTKTEITRALVNGGFRNGGVAETRCQAKNTKLWSVALGSSGKLCFDLSASEFAPKRKGQIPMMLLLVMFLLQQTLLNSDASTVASDSRNMAEQDIVEEDA
eukprot:1131423-Amphidinium_carterae.1